MKARDYIKALAGSLNDYKALRNMLEEAQGDLGLAQSKVVELQKRMEKQEENLQAVSADCSRYMRERSHAEHKWKAYETALYAFCPKLEATEDMKRFYECIAPYLDKEGYQLFFSAKKLTGFSPEFAFPYEDARGVFEEANGYQLMKYLVSYRFDAVEWNIVPCTTYESATLLPVDTSTPEYQVFERAVYEPAPDIPFEEWDNPWFESNTAGRVASIYYDLVCEADPQFAAEHPDRAKEISLLVYEMQYWGVGRIALNLAKIKDMDGLDDAVRNRLSRVIRELTEYKDRVGPLPGRAKVKNPHRLER